MKEYSKLLWNLEYNETKQRIAKTKEFDPNFGTQGFVGFAFNDWESTSRLQKYLDSLMEKNKEKYSYNRIVEISTLFMKLSEKKQKKLLLKL